jgi:hypothetical protein
MFNGVGNFPNMAGAHKMNKLANFIREDIMYIYLRKYQWDLIVICKSPISFVEPN